MSAIVGKFMDENEKVLVENPFARKSSNPTIIKTQKAEQKSDDLGDKADGETDKNKTDENKEDTDK